MKKLLRTTARMKKRALSRIARVNMKPIIVLGKEKSGTTAIAALLAHHSNLSVTLDIPQIWGDPEVALFSGVLPIDRFIKKNATAFSRDVVKEPCLTFLYPLLKKFYSSARYVMIVRDPRENIRSVFNRLGFPGSIEKLEERSFNELRRGWQTVLDSSWLGVDAPDVVSMAAERWNRAADVYLENRDEMALVRYEDFLNDKEAVIADLAEILELKKEQEIGPLLDQQFQKKGICGVEPEEFFGRRNLAKIKSICKDRMKSFGYET